MWLYKDYRVLDLPDVDYERLSKSRWDLNFRPNACLYCQSELRVLPPSELQLTVLVCSSCGWWVVTFLRHHDTSDGDYRREFWRYAGVIRALDLADIATPIDTIKRYLTARFDLRHRIDPHKLEDVVGGVFVDFGYSVRVTGSSGRDDGVDVIVLERENGHEIGIQVKRHRGKIQAKQIREFGGALVLRDLTCGIFVTTSSYTTGARRTAERFGERGIGIELWDAARFYDRLRITRQLPYRRNTQRATPFYSIIRLAKKNLTLPEKDMVFGERSFPYDL